MGCALKKIYKFLHSVHFSLLVSLPTLRTMIRKVTKTGLKRVEFTVNSIAFSDNYCTASRKLSYKPVCGIKMVKRQLRIWPYVALTANNTTSEAVESDFATASSPNQIFKLIERSDCH